jgi:Zn-dependent protease
MANMIMNDFKDFLVKLKQYFRFSKEEIEACTISILILAFIISFNEWGYGDKFDFNIGLLNWIKSIIIVGIVLLSHVAAVKLKALYYGYRAEYKIWWYGILIGLGLAFFTGSIVKGNVSIIWFLAPGGFFFHHMAKHRLGWFRYGVNMMETGWSLTYGVLMTIILAIIIRFFLFIFPSSVFLYKIMVVSLWFAFFMMLPIPPLSGSRIFFWSRLFYAFAFGVVIGVNLVLRFNINFIWMIIISLIVGIIVWLLQLIYVEGT